MRSLSGETKQAWIHDIGVAEEKEETQYLTKEPVGVKPVFAAHIHRVVFWKHLRWSLEMPSEMKFLDPAIIELLGRVSIELEDFQTMQQS